MKVRMRLLILATLGFVIALSVMAASGRSGSTRTPYPDDQATAAAGQEKPLPTPDRAWQRLKAGNKRFADEMMEKQDLGAKRRQELSKGQKPFAVVLTCADSRLVPEFIFNQGLGDIFVLRVAGNIAEPYFLASIEYAVEHFHVPLIVVLGHEKCGAVGAALGAEKPTGNLGKLIGDVNVGKDLPADKEAALAAAVKNNARHQARSLTERSSVIKEHVAKKKVRIVSGVYQFASGQVEWLEDIRE